MSVSILDWPKEIGSGPTLDKASWTHKMRGKKPNEKLTTICTVKSRLNPSVEREGLVWGCGSGDDRISFKTISNKFLAKYGD